MLSRFGPWIKANLYILSLTILFIASIVLNELLKTHYASIAIMLSLTILAGYHIFKKAIIDIRYKIIGIDLLVTIAVIGAMILGDFFEGAAVTYLFTLGHYLEKRSLEKTRSALSQLMDLKPTLARKLNEGSETMVGLDELLLGDIIIVRAGEKIPTDSEILEGVATIDEQMMTVESLPVEKTVGAKVFGATIVTSGYLKLTVTAIGEDTALSQIIHLVEDAQDKKAKTQKFIEKFARFYTPLIVLSAIVLYLFTFDIRLAITMLVISCPGALVIATPVSYVAGIGNGAKKGILFKGGESVDRLSKAKVVMFDKTGTLTMGKPELKQIKTYDFDENELIKLAAIGEKYSEHPLAIPLVEEAKKRGLVAQEEPSNLEMIVARGIQFSYQTDVYTIGNHRFDSVLITDQIREDIEVLESQGHTTLVMAKNNQVIGLFALGDTLRPDAKNLVTKLRKHGIKKLIMLTGDRDRVANVVATELGLDDYHAGLLPEEKAEIVKTYEKSANTIFVGDGINDALALSYASSSVAIGGLGKDLAMATSDVVLMGGDLVKLDEAIRLSKRVRANMYQNVLFALLVVLFLIVGVIFKTVNMTIGMLVHELSVLLVLVNAMRLIGKRRN